MDNHIFRSAIGGFNRQDVTEYIERTQKQAEEAAAALNKQLEDLRQAEGEARAALEERERKRLREAPAALVLPPSQVICRLVTMPRMTTGQLEMNLPYEFSDFIQGVADQYHCDYAVCAPAGEDGVELASTRVLNLEDLQFGRNYTKDR